MLESFFCTQNSQTDTEFFSTQNPQTGIDLKISEAEKLKIKNSFAPGMEAVMSAGGAVAWLHDGG